MIEAFVRLHEQGLVYRGAYIVNWDPVIQTAVSDLEVVHEERVGKLYHVRYPLADGSGSIVIATTRPETMLGDTAVAVNPSDERYQALVGKMLTLPLTGREIPVVADDWAKPEFGTGAVKVTPAHDPNDFAIGQRHSLPSVTILDKTAKVDLPGSKYHGLDRYVAREQIVEDLDKLGLLVAVKDHAMSVGTSQRSGSVIEPRLSNQWFVKIQPLADKAIAAVKEGHIRITPEMYEKTYNEWMSNIHDWCVSRQLVVGAPHSGVVLPGGAFYGGEDGSGSVQGVWKRGAGAGDGCAGYMVLLGAAAVYGVRVAGGAGIRDQESEIRGFVAG